MTPLSVEQLFDLSENYPSLEGKLAITDQCIDIFNSAPEDSRMAVLALFEEHSSAVSEFQKVIVGSDFATTFLIKNLPILQNLLRSDELNKQKSQADYDAQIDHLLTSVTETAALDKCLRIFRNQELSRIIWRDLNRLADTLEITSEISALAQSLLNAALNFHYNLLAQRFGAPCNSAGEQQPMLIIGMGKLGAWELNLSSDIDLIFAYPDKGETQGGRKNIENQDFFTRLGQAIIKSLDANTTEGFVFRVDMRLRPYGQSGALVSCFDALEVYYHNQGREWERFAMIKARVVATNGDANYIEQLENLLREFTYRRYVDFSAIDALRDLKAMISREVKRKSLENDIKLGSGGIREIEFIAQSFQLIRGGRDTELQDRRLSKIMPLLVKLECLPDKTDEKLLEAYYFLRNVEHGIQALQDKQTQSIPVDDLQRLRLALALGFADEATFLAAVDERRKIVEREFKLVISDPKENEEAEDSDLNKWREIWKASVQPQRSLAMLEDHQALFSAIEADKTQTELKLVAEHLQTLMENPSVVSMHAQGRERLDELMPRLLSQVGHLAEPAQTLGRLLNLLSAIARRSAYLLLLIENPDALQQLVTLSEASPWIADQLAEHPALLDELIHPESLYSMPSKDDLRHELRQMLLRIDEQDLEGQMEALRYFRSAHGLQVAACEVTERLPLMKVSDYLSELAEVILEFALHMAWQQMIYRHGEPGKDDDGRPEFIILGYGKLGGLELGHGSDLDLVFVHNANPQLMSTGDENGKRAIDNLTYYMRLGQKLIHLLTTNTPSGQVYEVDMRLRPSGNSGMLVSSFKAFEKYQRDSAWTWEHQALIRARVVAGGETLAEQFLQLRHEILSKERDLETLQKDVIEMRHKMRDHLGSNKKEQEEGQFQLKQDAGGIVDIEFMVQYAVLAWSHKYPALQRYTDNIRILGDLRDSELLSAQEAEQLIEAYKAFRSMGHRLALQQESGKVDASLFESERTSVKQTWQKLLGSGETPA